MHAFKKCSTIIKIVFFGSCSQCCFIRFCSFISWLCGALQTNRTRVASSGHFVRSCGLYNRIIQLVLEICQYFPSCNFPLYIRPYSVNIFHHNFVRSYGVYNQPHHTTGSWDLSIFSIMQYPEAMIWNSQINITNFLGAVKVPCEKCSLLRAFPIMTVLNIFNI